MTRKEIEQLEQEIKLINTCIEVAKIETNKTLFKSILNRLQMLIKTDSNSNYQQCMDAYFKWHEDVIGLKPRIDSRQGSALKEIIAYLAKVVKTPGQELQAFQAVLHNYELWGDFFKGQTTLVQINKNLIELITNIKNGAKSKESSISKLKQKYRDS